jgi:hypothetical protein
VRTCQCRRAGTSLKLGEVISCCDEVHDLSLPDTPTLLPWQVLSLFLEVWGVGTQTAQRWYSLGLRTLDDLRSSKAINLTEYQRVGFVAVKKG